MSTTTPPIAAPDSWLDANQRYLSAEFERIGTMLDVASGARGEEAIAAAEARIAEAKLGLREDAAIDVLATAFSLSPFERDVVLLCAGTEMESLVARRTARAQRDAGTGRRGTTEDATFGIALAVLPGAHWSALTPAGPLRHWPLLTLGSGSLTAAPLRIEERVLHFLAGINQLDPAVEPLTRQASPRTIISTVTHTAVVDEIVRAWAGLDGTWPPVHLIGDDVDGHEDIAWQAVARIGLTLHELRAGDLPSGVRDRAALATRWTREAILLGAGLLVRVGDVEEHPSGTPSAADLRDFITRLGAPVIVSSRSAFDLTPATRYSVDVPAPLEQRGLWQSALGDTAEHWSDAVEIASSQFRLSARSILHTGSALAHAGGPTPPDALATFYRELRRGRPPRVLDGLVQRIEPAAGWDDLVLAEDWMETLREIAGQVRHRTRVYEEWGFAGRGARGLGISALFAGESGTGKTMAAEVLSRELGLELYRIDLSTVVSKYIGETEKNLRRVFDAGDESGAILLFDEADALFGKRSEVRDSHDRYANIEVSYLLQRMDAYRGLAVLTTNARGALDRSFQRRLRFVVQFPFPDARHRERIWRKVFPADAPVRGLDYPKLARLGLSGGAIRNIAVLAAFRAAAADTPVTMQQLAWAARTELEKAEKTPAEADLRGWTS